MKNRAVWVALGVLAIATAMMVFVIMPNINGKGDDAATGSGVAATDGAAPQGDTATLGKAGRVPADGEEPAAPEGAASAGGTGTDTATADGAAADGAAGWVTPGFDVLRVEPDGSTVIAGRAEPNTRLEIVDGDRVVATTDVGPDGDFAAVFDKPLDAGDHELTLRSVGEGGQTKTSEEVATISVPRDQAGDLLAMVARPGEASRLITTPTAGAAAETATADTATANAEPAPETVSETAAAATQDAAPETAADAAPAGDQPAGTQQAATGNAAAGTAAASVDPAAGTGNAAVTAAGLRVSAVEIEGDKLFVAGAAKAGALVRIYANDNLLGEGKADEEGRFVIDGTMPLSVGSHVIRADMLGADGSRVEFRASVPFERPMGEQVAVVAGPQASQGQPAGGMAAVGGGVFDRLRGDATKALNLLKALFQDGKAPTAEELAAARSATEIALDSLARFKLAEAVDARAAETVASASRGAAEALALLKALPQDAASVSAAIGRIETAIGGALMPRSDDVSTNTQPATATDAATPSQDMAELPGPAISASDTAPAGGSADAQAETQSAAVETPAADPVAEPETVEQAPLQQSKSSVIIRRGDTLWQISRRVYGAGVRYTTIYLANEDQITNPDRIRPGQVFGVPDEALPDAEEVHRKRLRGN